MINAFRILFKEGFFSFVKYIKLHFFIKKFNEFKTSSKIYELKRENANIFSKERHINFYSENILNDLSTISKLNNYGYSVNLKYKLDFDYDGYLPVSSIEKVDKLQKVNYKNLLKERIYGNQKIDLTIVVLNYNNKNCIFKCIDSLIEHNKYNYKIIVVDNCSVDGSYEILLSKYKNSDVRIIKNTQNGCSSGRNLAIKDIKTEYTMFLDSDQFVMSDYWLDNYIYIANNSDNFGACGWACGWFDKGIPILTNFDLLMNRMPPYGLYRNDIDYLGTGGMLVKTNLFKKCKFDLNYDPTGYEDTDFSMQIKHAGYKLYYSPYLDIEHKAHQTTMNNDYKKLLDRNKKYFKNKWYKKGDSDYE